MNEDYGNYDLKRKKRGSRVSYYDGDDIDDEDRDGISDKFERKIGMHDHKNQPRHFSMQASLPKTKYGMLGINHQFLGPIQIGTNKKKKMKLTMNTPKSMKLSLDIKAPKISGFNIKAIHIPKALMDDRKIKTNTGSFEMKHLEAFLKKVKKRRMKV